MTKHIYEIKLPDIVPKFPDFVMNVGIYEKLKKNRVNIFFIT